MLSDLEWVWWVWMMGLPHAQASPYIYMRKLSTMLCDRRKIFEINDLPMWKQRFPMTNYLFCYYFFALLNFALTIKHKQLKWTKKWLLHRKFHSHRNISSQGFKRSQSAIFEEQMTTYLTGLYLYCHVKTLNIHSHA